MSLKEQTDALLKKLFTSLMTDLYVEFGYVLETLESDGYDFGMIRGNQDLAGALKDIFQGSLEDLPKYLEGYAELGKVAAWRLANPEAELADVIDAAFGQAPRTDEGLLDGMLKKFTYESRMKALNFAYAEAFVLHELFKLYGMDKENKAAQALTFTLPEQVEGWN